MQATSWAGSSLEKTRPKVSCEGTPFTSVRKPRSQASRSLPKRSMSAQVSEPARVAQSATTTKSNSSCRRDRAIRGSVRVSNVVKTAVSRWDMKNTSVIELLHEGIDQASLDSFNSREILPKITCDCRGDVSRLQPGFFFLCHQL